MSEEVEEIKLTGKQKLFADYYIGEAALNATRAARLAKYSGDDNALAAAGSRLLRNVKVREYIDEQLKGVILSRNEMLTILTKHAKGSLADVLDENGEFDLKDAKRRGVDGLMKEIEIKEAVKKDSDGSYYTETTHKYKIYDAQSAIGQISRIQGMIVDKSELDVNFTETQVIRPKLDDDDS